MARSPRQPTVVGRPELGVHDDPFREVAKLHQSDPQPEPGSVLDTADKPPLMGVTVRS